MLEFRKKILQFFYNLCPFDIRGDADITMKNDRLLSCIIPTYRRPYELDRLLSCLSMQDVDRRCFEIVIIEDGMSRETEEIVERHSQSLNVQLKNNKEPLHSLGALRNQGLELSLGRYILLLDDDTLILQESFLSILLERFRTMQNIDCVMIPGESDRCLLKHKYSHLTKYSFGAACIAYRRAFLVKLGGFFNDMVSYEDIELSIRFLASGGIVYHEHELRYYHPPFYYTSWEKPISNGKSFLRMFRRYSFPVWLLCYINALRFLLYLVLPSRKLRQFGKISAGFLVAPMTLKTDKTRNDHIYR